MKIYEILHRQLERKYSFTSANSGINTGAFLHVDRSLPALLLNICSTPSVSWPNIYGFSLLNNALFKFTIDELAFITIVNTMVHQYLNTTPDKYKLIIDKPLTFIGLGGVGWNILDMLYRLVQYGTAEIKSEIKVYEFDELEFSNLPRLPIKYLSSTNFSKVYHAYYLRNLLPITFIQDRWSAKEYKDDSILVGAPSIRTRREIIQHKFPHMFITYQNDILRVKQNFVHSNALLFETYGRTKIDILLLGLLYVVLTLNTYIDETLNKNEYLYEIKVNHDQPIYLTEYAISKLKGKAFLRISVDKEDLSTLAQEQSENNEEQQDANNSD